MKIEVMIRHPFPQEHELAKDVVRTAANETFQDLFAPNPVPLKLDEEDWSVAWVAVCESQIVGVTLTREEWISDLWVLRGHRRQGVGRELLAQGEAEIAARGHKTCRLRVVKSNAVAVQFYLHQGWRIAREFPHEKYHHAMLEMVKSNLEDRSSR